jgi:hypothetical protein
MSITGEGNAQRLKTQMEALGRGTGAQVQPVQGSRAGAAFFGQTDTTRVMANNGFRSQ